MRSFTTPVPFRTASAALWGGLFISAACTGAVSGGDDPQVETDRVGSQGAGSKAPKAGVAATDGTNPAGPPTALPVGMMAIPPGSVGSASAGPLPLRRLTRTEYLNTIRDLFGDPMLTIEMELDPRGQHGFAEAPLVAKETAMDLLEAAETIAASAARKIEDIVGCIAAAKGDEICAREIVSKMGRRIYRRPVPQVDVDSLLALFTKAKTILKYSFADSARVLLTAMLMSPRFLYHWETGDEKAVIEGGLVRLSGHEMASRLSYFIWAGMPDGELFQAADAGKLESDSDLSAQITRMMKHEKFTRTVEVFHSQWLELDGVAGLSKDGTLYPAFTEAIKASMVKETSRFVSWAMTTGDAKLTTLLTSTTGFVNAGLAKIYDVKGVTGDALVQVMLDSKQRAGLLTQGAVIASHTNAGGSNPARMGKMLFSSFMCGELAPPPPDAVIGFKFDNKLTTRGNFEVIEKQAACAGCHKLINPMGYAYEQFDAIGKLRQVDNGMPVNAGGSVSVGGASRPYSDVTGLAGLLAGAPEVQSCIAKMWARYGFQRNEEAGDSPSLAQSQKGFVSTGSDLRELIKAIAISRSFRFRTTEAQEVQ